MASAGLCDLAAFQRNRPHLRGAPVRRRSLLLARMPDRRDLSGAGLCSNRAAGAAAHGRRSCCTARRARHRPAFTPTHAGGREFAEKSLGGAMSVITA
ncbi:hypothetical protein BCEN4_520004 [Burkholderia cenocepacia]|nr:hypothetical protein BCEN4_520004 [Burkholderia cenocepacia]